MLPFDFRHVMKLHVLSNDEYQVPQSGQTRVASQQTDGPRTKLGYDRLKTDLYAFFRVLHFSVLCYCSRALFM